MSLTPDVQWEFVSISVTGLEFGIKGVTILKPRYNRSLTRSQTRGLGASLKPRQVAERCWRSSHCRISSWWSECLQDQEILSDSWSLPWPLNSTPVCSVAAERASSPQREKLHQKSSSSIKQWNAARPQGLTSTSATSELILQSQ